MWNEMSWDRMPGTGTEVPTIGEFLAGNPVPGADTTAPTSRSHDMSVHRRDPSAFSLSLGLLLSKPLTRELCSRIEESQWLLRENLRVYARQLQATEHFIEIQGLTLSSVASHGVDWGEP